MGKKNKHICNNDVILETSLITKKNPIFIKEIQDFVFYYIEENMKRFNDVRIKGFGKFVYINKIKR